MTADHVLIGRDGWLFLAEGSNRSISQMTGRISISPRTRTTWTRTLQMRDMVFDERTLTVICPEKSAVYPTRLPDGYTISENRFARQLERTVRGVMYATPPAELADRYYLKTDTHWTDLGSHHCAKTICDRLDIDTFEVPERWTVRQQNGDLGVVVTPPQRSTNWILEDAPELAVIENGLRNRGRVVRYTRSERGARILIFGDSFSGISLARHLAYRTGDVMFVHSLSFDYELIDRLRPDFIIGQVAERFLVDPIVDGRSIASLIAEKRLQRVFTEEMIDLFVSSLPEFEDVYGPSLRYLLPLIKESEFAS